MCANDVICCGAKPLFFLDYIACGKNVPEKIAAIVRGVAEGCVQAGCALVGGETAEMPGFYPVDEYDLAGFCVGAVDKACILDKETMRAGDAVLALPSSGVHSNGFSLVRKALRLEEGGLSVRYAELGDQSLGETLLTPTRIYVQPVLTMLEKVSVRSLSHITGGGFYENIPRSLGTGFAVRLEQKAVKTPPIFNIIAREGNVPMRDMYNTFNMGVGMTAIVHAAEADEALRILRDSGVSAYALGEVVAGEGGVTLC
jgi:phosphoribosylformylglycinamidine cyclo-ligase